jgi:excisionase family DNA binding protein
MEFGKPNEVSELQQFYTLKETADLLKLSRSGLHRLIQSGVIKAIYLGRRRRIPAAEIFRLAKQRK